VSRALVALAIKTGIPPSAWAAEGEQAIVTAVELLEQDGEPPTLGGVQMSG